MCVPSVHEPQEKADRMKSLKSFLFLMIMMLGEAVTCILASTSPLLDGHWEQGVFFGVVGMVGTALFFMSLSEEEG